ncbi:electron transport complex subunit RsxC [Shewanella woodyi]|uniref:Ion-translocating oxidoreductase complex subunit C n=1 Tax=Shewanella woodyi (strain ATCC 51908 / MS32) TaxID=392500 RepID=B1KGW6_SHEWM|nr:electron transport complex subunit RsxC [Shewanella woodyi]ACA86835.1 electron transport complex, RnfABCDGE type, C subunit [Shewanella woodyi ATCC 51908]
MLTLLEQIDKGTLWRAIGGIHPPEQKVLSNTTNIASLPIADEYVIPIPQVGDNATLSVSVGDYVTKGEVLTNGSHFGYLPVHAPTSGHISHIEQRPSNHASGLPVLSCVIKPDGLDTLSDKVHPKLALTDIEHLSNQEILSKIQQAGIAGLGGAAFPSHIKLNPASDIELLIINAIECEPYITSDDMIMREQSDAIMQGIAIVHRLLKPKRLIIAIEDNKPQAISIMQQALSRSVLPEDGVRITTLPTLYPSGGEKQLIQILTGQEVPSGAIPAQLGILVQNVATCYAIQDAVLRNYPLIERVVTITGNNVAKPGNYWLPIGTPISHLLSQTDFKGLDTDKVIIGGPMMGYALYNDSAPTLKGTNCILLPNANEMAPEQKELPCIRCGECAVVCPAQLLPQQLFWHSKAQEYDKAVSYNLNDCIECGCCSYVCPSNIPLVEYYRVAKSAVKNEIEEKKQAELAKQRFELRTQRLEDEKLAREAKQKEAADRRKANMSGTDKDAVAQAMARIKAKKEAEANSEVTTSAPADKRDAVAAAVARAKAKKAAQTSTEKLESSTTEEPVDDKKAKVAAAVARAKGKKAALKSADASTIEPKTDIATSEPAIDAPVIDVDDKKAKIAAAVARAKAKKAALKAADASATEPQSDSETSEVIPDTSVAQIDDKKAKIAAAVARAKAKKAALKAADTSIKHQNDAEASESVPDTPVVEVDDKKAKIAAAVAKAKAKKAALNAIDPQNDSATSEPATDAPIADVDDKKAKIAAAVAKAKANKLAKQAKLDNGKD